MVSVEGTRLGWAVAGLAESGLCSSLVGTGHPHAVAAPGLRPGGFRGRAGPGSRRSLACPAQVGCRSRTGRFRTRATYRGCHATPTRGRPRRLPGQLGGLTLASDGVARLMSDRRSPMLSRISSCTTSTCPTIPMFQINGGRKRFSFLTPGRSLPAVPRPSLRYWIPACGRIIPIWPASS